MPARCTAQNVLTYQLDLTALERVNILARRCYFPCDLPDRFGTSPVGQTPWVQPACSYQPATVGQAGHRAIREGHEPNENFHDLEHFQWCLFECRIIKLVNDYP